jgi:hypothetical protein
VLIIITSSFFFDTSTDTVPIYDGQKHQLKVPDDLRNIPSVLSRYRGQIPYHSLVLVAYTISLYRATQGPRKDQPTIPLNISFAVVLYDEPLEIKDSDCGEDTQNTDVVEDDDDKTVSQNNESAQYQNADEVQNIHNEEEALSDIAAEELSE